MPTYGYSSSHPINVDPVRWKKCLKVIEQQMLATGWVRSAGKFNEVQRRRAHRLWAKGPLH